MCGYKEKDKTFYEHCKHSPEVLETPESEVEGFVPYWEVDDENDDQPPRFCIIFATKKSKAKLSKVGFLQTDATYRLNWMGFPVFVLGMPFHVFIRLSVFSTKTTSKNS